MNPRLDELSPPTLDRPCVGPASHRPVIAHAGELVFTTRSSALHGRIVMFDEQWATKPAAGNLVPVALAPAAGRRGAGRAADSGSGALPSPARGDRCNRERGPGGRPVPGRGVARLRDRRHERRRIALELDALPAAFAAALLEAEVEGVELLRIRAVLRRISTRP